MLLKKMDMHYLTISMTTVAAPAETLTAEEILSKSIDAIGGMAALEKIKSKVSMTTAVVPKKKTEIKTTTFMLRPDKVYAVTEFKLLGKKITSEAGRLGDIVWQIIPGAIRSKNRILSGKEKDLRLADLAFDTAIVTWKDYYKSICLAGEETVDGRPCYKVSFSSFYEDGRGTIYFFDKETFLILKILKDIFIQDNYHGQAEIYPSNYQYADEVLIPHTIKRSSPQEDEVIISIDGIQSNVDIPESKFALPKKIAALAEKEGLL